MSEHKGMRRWPFPGTGKRGYFLWRKTPDVGGTTLGLANQQTNAIPQRKFAKLVSGYTRKDGCGADWPWVQVIRTMCP